MSLTLSVKLEMDQVRALRQARWSELPWHGRLLKQALHDKIKSSAPNKGDRIEFRRQANAQWIGGSTVIRYCGEFEGCPVVEWQSADYIQVLPPGSVVKPFQCQEGGK